MTTEYSSARLREICEGAHELKKILDGWIKEGVSRDVAAEAVHKKVADFLDLMSSINYLDRNSLDALLAIYQGAETREAVREYFECKRGVGKSRDNYVHRTFRGLQGLAYLGLIPADRRHHGLHINEPITLSEKGTYLARLFDENLVDSLYQSAEELPGVMEKAGRAQTKKEKPYTHLHKLVPVLSPEGKTIAELRALLKSAGLKRNILAGPLERALNSLIEKSFCICETGPDGIKRYKLPDVAVHLED